MKIKCPRCQAALTYNIEEASMVCEYCGSIFGIDDVKQDVLSAQEAQGTQPRGESGVVLEEEAPARADAQYVLPETEPKAGVSAQTAENLAAAEDDEQEEMNCKILSCSSCGATLMVNETESATFCAYCGQPSLIEDRISKQKRPKFILPFKIQKDEAERIVRDRFSKGFFVPEEIKNFKVDKLHGVYIPFRMIDVYCQDEVVIRAAHKSGKSTSYTYHYRKAYNLFKGITVDASNLLSNESSVRLEPYHLKELKPFEPAFLSGFYANCMDTTQACTDMIAKNRARMLFEAELKQSVKTGGSMSITEANPYQEVDESVYIMLPAWFLSFSQNGKNYTIMVNGQTGKCVGGVPYVKARVSACIAFLSILLTPFLSTIMKACIYSGDSDSGKPIAALLVIGLGAGWFGWMNFKGIQKSCDLTSSADMKTFANDRQEV